MSSIRILVVEDFEPWRRFLSLLVEQDTQLRIIFEVSDGLDIGLPKLNGIAASRQILRFRRKPKILFLSQESSSDVVREALRIGAGFVLKTDASRELLSGVKAVMLGEQFLSSSVTVHKPERAVGGYVPEGLQ